MRDRGRERWTRNDGRVVSQRKPVILHFEFRSLPFAIRRDNLYRGNVRRDFPVSSNIAFDITIFQLPYERRMEARGTRFIELVPAHKGFDVGRKSMRLAVITNSAR